MVHGRGTAPSASAQDPGSTLHSAVLTLAAQRGLLRSRSSDRVTNSEHQRRQRQQLLLGERNQKKSVPFFLSCKADMMRYVLLRLLQLQHWSHAGVLQPHDSHLHTTATPTASPADADASASRETGMLNLAQLGAALLRGVQLCSYPEAGRDFVSFSGQSSGLNKAASLRRWLQEAERPGEAKKKKVVRFESEAREAAHAVVGAAEEPILVKLLFNISAVADSDLFNAVLLRFVQGVCGVAAAAVLFPLSTSTAATVAAASGGGGDHDGHCHVPSPSTPAMQQEPHEQAHLSIGYLCHVLHYLALKMIKKLHEDSERDGTQNDTACDPTADRSAISRDNLYNEAQLLLNLFSVLSVLSFFCRDIPAGVGSSGSNLNGNHPNNYNYSNDSTSGDDYAVQLFQALLEHDEGNRRSLSRYAQVKFVRVLQQLKVIGQNAIRWTRIATESVSSNFVGFLEMLYEHDDIESHCSRLDLLVLKILSAYLKMFPIMKLSMLRYFETTNDTDFFDFSDYFKLEVLVDNCLFLYANPKQGGVTTSYSLQNWVLTEDARNAMMAYSSALYTGRRHLPATRTEMEKEESGCVAAEEAAPSTAAGSHSHTTTSCAPARDGCCTISPAASSAATASPFIHAANLLSHKCAIVNTAGQHCNPPPTSALPSTLDACEELEWDNNNNNNSNANNKSNSSSGGPDNCSTSASNQVNLSTATHTVRPKRWRKRTLEEVKQFNFGYIGLCNIGNTCFLNSTTQLVFAADYFAKELIYTTFFHCRPHGGEQRAGSEACDAAEGKEQAEAEAEIIQGHTETAVKALAALLQPRDSYGKCIRNRYYGGGGDDDFSSYDPRKAKVCLATLFAQMYIQLYERFREAVGDNVEESGSDGEGNGGDELNATGDGRSHLQPSSGSLSNPAKAPSAIISTAIDFYTRTKKKNDKNNNNNNSSGSSNWRSTVALAATAISPSYFVEALPYPFHTRTQQDASEYNKVVFDIVDTEDKKEYQELHQQKNTQGGGDGGETKKDAIATSVTRWFAGTSQTTMMCNECGATRRHSNEFLDLCIPIKKVKQMKKKVIAVPVKEREEKDTVARRDAWDLTGPSNPADAVTVADATTPALPQDENNNNNNNNNNSNSNNSTNNNHHDVSGNHKTQVHHVDGNIVTAVTTYGPHASSSSTDGSGSNTTGSDSSRSSSCAGAENKAQRGEEKAEEATKAAGPLSHDPYGGSSEHSDNLNSSQKKNANRNGGGSSSSDDDEGNHRLRSCTSATSSSPSSSGGASPTAAVALAAPAVQTQTVEVVAREITVDLQTLLLAVTVPYFNQELLTADNQTTCAACAKKTDTRLYTQLIPNAAHLQCRAPFYLTLQVNRFEYNKKLYNYAKVFEQVPLNEILFLPVYHHPEALDAAPQLVPYTIKAVIVHSGSTPHSGHYYCLVRRRPRLATARTAAEARGEEGSAVTNYIKSQNQNQQQQQQKKEKMVVMADEAAAAAEREQELQSQKEVKEYIRDYLLTFMSFYHTHCSSDGQRDDGEKGGAPPAALNDKLLRFYEYVALRREQKEKQKQMQSETFEKEANDTSESEIEKEKEDKYSGNHPNVAVSSNFYEQWYVCNDSNTSAAAMERVKTLFCHHNSNKNVSKDDDEEEEDDLYGGNGGGHLNNYFMPHRNHSYMGYSGVETSYLLLYEQTNMNGSPKESTNLFSDTNNNNQNNNNMSAESGDGTFYDDARYLFDHLPESLQPLCKREPTLPPSQQQQQQQTSNLNNGNNDNKSTNVHTKAGYYDEDYNISLFSKAVDEATMNGPTVNSYGSYNSYGSSSYQTEAALSAVAAPAAETEIETETGTAQGSASHLYLQKKAEAKEDIHNNFNTTNHYTDSKNSKVKGEEEEKEDVVMEKDDSDSFLYGEAEGPNELD